MTRSFEEELIALLPKLSAFLSMGGSGYIIVNVIKTGQIRQSSHSRILLGLSACDLWVSFSLFISTWAEPADRSNSVWAVGNQLTCNVQGFLHQMGLAVVLYNAALSAYYVAKIRCRYSDQVITTRLEPFLHGVPWLFGVGTASAAWSLDLYNGSGWGCWINSYPANCGVSASEEDDATGIPCEQGDNAYIFRWAMYFAPLWAAVLMACINMFLVY